MMNLRVIVHILWRGFNPYLRHGITGRLGFALMWVTNHVSKMIALAVQCIAAVSDEFIELGDISVEKEWTFAGDVAKEILTLVDQDEAFEAVIGSGVALFH